MKYEEKSKVQTEMAKTLCKKAGLPDDRYLGLNDIQAFEKILNVNILALSSKLGNKFIRIATDHSKPNLYLYLVETESVRHWHGISNIQGFFFVKVISAKAV